MTTGDDQSLAGADTLGTFKQGLLELGKAALAKHPLLEAMATQIRVTTEGAKGDTWAVWYTFDGPALPEKQNCEVLMPPAAEFHRHALDAFMVVCEETLARIMRNAGYSGVRSGVRGVGGGSAGQGFASTYVGGGAGGSAGGGAGGGAGPGGTTHGMGGCGGPIFSGDPLGGAHVMAGGGVSGSGTDAVGGASEPESEPSFHGSGPVD
jgi:hypothetical protein